MPGCEPAPAASATCHDLTYSTMTTMVHLALCYQHLAARRGYLCHGFLPRLHTARGMCAVLGPLAAQRLT
jgi:hypothetical protein